jgi:hypothetical protein
MESNVVVNQNTSQITVIIDTVGPNLYPVADLLNKLELNYSKIEDAVNNIYSNSAIYLNQKQVEQLLFLQNLSSGWQETYDEVNLIQNLSSGWQETYDEVNTIQQDFSGNWQSTTEYIKSGIIDAGFF